jgi:hypothetical protein
MYRNLLRDLEATQFFDTQRQYRELSTLSQTKASIVAEDTRLAFPRRLPVLVAIDARLCPTSAHDLAQIRAAIPVHSSTV